jgi:hypothetical protein
MAQPNSVSDIIAFFLAVLFLGVDFSKKFFLDEDDFLNN